MFVAAVGREEGREAGRQAGSASSCMCKKRGHYFCCVNKKGRKGVVAAAVGSGEGWEAGRQAVGPPCHRRAGIVSAV